MKSLSEFIKFILKQDETALLIAKDSSKLRIFAEALEERDFKKSPDYKDCLENLTADRESYAILNAELSFGMKSLITQLNSRGSCIQIPDQDSLELRDYFINRDRAILALLILEKDFKLLTESYNLLDKVGAVFRGTEK